jgi:hypothetical protein
MTPGSSPGGATEQLSSCGSMADAADLKSVFYLLVRVQPGVLRDVIQWSEAMLWEHRAVGSNPTIPIVALVTQLVEVLRLERSGYWFESSQGYLI